MIKCDYVHLPAEDARIEASSTPTRKNLRPIIMSFTSIAEVPEITDLFSTRCKKQIEIF